MDLMGTLRQKYAGIPVWILFVVGTGVLALWLQKRNKNNADKAQADQTNTDLGTASNLANMFTVAGIMPYMGGDVYVNQTVNTGTTGNPKPKPRGPWTKPYPIKRPPIDRAKVPGASSSPPKVITVHKGDTLTAIARKYGLSWQDVYKYNTSTGPKGANRPPSTIATLKSRGPNRLYSGEQIYIPKKGTVYAGGY